LGRRRPIGIKGKLPGKKKNFGRDHEQLAAQYRKDLIDGPVLALSPVTFNNTSFDPNPVFSLDDIRDCG
jgi:hypothetical protein